jgi:transcriptional regulator with XRE-family HTH domain
MLAIRITGAKLKKARKLVGWSLQETATRAQVNWLTIKRYEGAGEYLPSGTVGALNRLVYAFEAPESGSTLTAASICSAPRRLAPSLPARGFRHVRCLGQADGCGRRCGSLHPSRFRQPR